MNLVGVISSLGFGNIADDIASMAKRRENQNCSTVRYLIDHTASQYLRTCHLILAISSNVIISGQSLYSWLWKTCRALECSGDQVFKCVSNWQPRTLSFLPGSLKIGVRSSKESLEVSYLDRFVGAPVTYYAHQIFLLKYLSLWERIGILMIVVVSGIQRVGFGALPRRAFALQD